MRFREAALFEFVTMNKTYHFQNKTKINFIFILSQLWTDSRTFSNNRVAKSKYPPKMLKNGASYENYFGQTKLPKLILSNSLCNILFSNKR